MNNQTDIKWMVCVHCPTYNHAPYIKETLDGFCKQETNFPFVCVVVDDCSTDGEQTVLKDYLTEHFEMTEITQDIPKETDDYLMAFARHKTNHNCYFAFHQLKYNHGYKKPRGPYYIKWDEDSKYIARCEGDDYWIHPKKIQMQVDFLESHPEYVLTYTDFELTTGGYRNHSYVKVKDDNYFPSSIIQGLSDIGTLTVLYRYDVYKRTPKLWVGKGWPMGDFQQWIEMSHEGKFKRLSVITAKYRILPQSASHGSFEKEIRFIKAIRDVRFFYANYYGVELPNDGFSNNYYVDIIKTAFKHNNIEEARRFKDEARKRKMTSTKMWFFYYATIIKPIGWWVRKFLSR